MSVTNDINEDVDENPIRLIETKVLKPKPDVFVGDIQSENGDLNDLPSMIDSTTPTLFKTEHIQKLNLKYPTKHLKGFDDLRKSTRLFGNEYMLILKAVWYGIFSCITSEVTLKLNQIETDGRIHLLIPLKSGKGKRELKRVIKQTFEVLNKAADEPTSLHPEQLVGKTVRRQHNKNVIYEQIEGYLSRDYIIIDEGRTLLTSEDLIFSESRRYLRLAQDSYPYNHISKRPVDVPFGEELKFTPYVGTCIFTQPYLFNEDFATDGDLRRYLVPYVNMSDIDRTAAYKSRILETVDSAEALRNFTSLVSSLDKFIEFEFSKDAIPYFMEATVLLIRRGFRYSKKVHNFVDLYDFTIQDLLLKMCAVQSKQDQSKTINKNHVELAFIDLVEFAEHLYDFVTLKITGMMDYGEGWAGSEGNDRIILEWLYEKGATSENNSDVTIGDYETTIMNVCNVKGRRARSIKKNHESKGWIKSYKAPDISKVWINFNPKSLEEVPAIGALPIQEKYDEILKKIDTLTASNAPKSNMKIDDKNSLEVKETPNLTELTNKELCDLSYNEFDDNAIEIYEQRLLKELDVGAK